MSVNFVDIDKYLHTWVTTFITTESIYWAERGRTVKSTPPFTTMARRTYREIGLAYQTPPSATGFITNITPVELIVNFMAYGLNSEGRLANIKALGDHPNAQDVISANGIALVDTFLPILNANTLVDQTWEERATTDLIFRFSVTHGENDEIESGIIEKVEVDATYDVCGVEKTSLINIDSTV